MNDYILSINEYRNYILNEESLDTYEEKMGEPDQNKLKLFFAKNWKKILLILGSVGVGVTAGILINRYFTAKNGQTSPISADNLKHSGFDVTNLGGGSDKKYSSKEVTNAVDSLIKDTIREFGDDISTQTAGLNFISDIVNQTEPSQDVTKDLVDKLQQYADKEESNFKKVHDDSEKAIEFIKKEKDSHRDFEERPLTVFYTEYTRKKGIEKVTKKINSDEEYKVVLNSLLYKKKNSIIISDWFKKYPDLVRNSESTVALNVAMYQSGAQVGFLNNFFKGLGRPEGTKVTSPVRNIEKKMERSINKTKSDPIDTTIKPRKSKEEIYNREDELLHRDDWASAQKLAAYLKGHKK